MNQFEYVYTCNFSYFYCNEPILWKELNLCAFNKRFIINNLCCNWLQKSIKVRILEENHRVLYPALRNIFIVVIKYLVQLLALG